MFCRHVNVSGLKIDNPPREQIEEFVRRFLAGDLVDISLETEAMSGIGMEFLGHPSLGYCAYGVEESPRGSFAYESFNGRESNVLKEIGIYQFPESAFFADPGPIGRAALEFAVHGKISRQVSWKFRFQIEDDTITPNQILSVDDPRSVEAFLATYASRLKA